MQAAHPIHQTHCFHIEVCDIEDYSAWLTSCVRFEDADFFRRRLDTFCASIEEILEDAFKQACIVFEEFNGERAANDFCNEVPSDGRAVDRNQPDVLACPGAKENGQDLSPCVAPSADNVRIGAALL